MEIINCEQRSPEWFEIKAGVPSPSKFAEIITTKGLPSKQRDKYLYQLAGESVAGIREDSYQSAAMQRGCELESEARTVYEFMTGNQVVEVGFIKCDTAGGSPDGLINDDGGVEIKCPLISTHVGYKVSGKLPTTYFQQVQGYLYITGRQWWDFFSYYPGLKPLLVRVVPDKKFHEVLHNELIKFNEDLKKTIEKIK